MSKKQTAVEWLMNELANTGLLVTKDIDNLVAYRKAKQMEKEQIIKAYEDNHALSHLYGNNGEIYYKEIYG